MVKVKSLGLVVTITLGLAEASQARVTRFIIEARELATPVQSGELPYEIIRGHFEGRLDPFDAHNRIITDLSSAPRDTLARICGR